MSRNEMSAYAGVEALVLGASGFIGRWVARYLTAAGANLTLIVRDTMAARPVFDAYAIDGELCLLNLEDHAALSALLREVRPAITFNLAGYGVDRSERDRATAHRINADLVQALATAVAELGPADWPGQQIVHVGSALEYGTISGNLDEISTPNPTTLYGQSKLAGTLALADVCRKRGCRGLTARLFTVYGPGEHPGRLVPSLLETAATDEPLLLTAGTQRRDFTYVEDVAEGLLRLGVSAAEPGAVVNLATGSLSSVKSFIETAADVLDIPPQALQFGARPTRPEEMVHNDVTIQRLQHLTGWRPTTEIAEGVRRTAVFHQSTATPWSETS